MIQDLYRDIKYIKNNPELFGSELSTEYTVALTAPKSLRNSLTPLLDQPHKTGYPDQSVYTPAGLIEKNEITEQLSLPEVRQELIDYLQTAQEIIPKITTIGNINDRINTLLAEVIDYDDLLPISIKLDEYRDSTVHETNVDKTLPDPTICIAEQHEYGYTSIELLPLNKERALELYNNDNAIFLLYPDNTESMVSNADEIRTFDGIFGIEREDWQKSHTHKEMTTNTISIQQQNLKESETMSKFDISARVNPLKDQSGNTKAMASVTIDNVVQRQDK